MTVLMIDTSTERGLVALGNVAGQVVAEKRLPPGYQNSDHLFPTLQALGIELQSLELIVCAVGPGSFTGIRVGASVAKALSFALQVPLVGVNTLEGFAAPALIDAKSGGAYVLNKDGSGSGDRGTWSRLPLEEALQKLGNGAGSGACEVYTPSAVQLRVKAPAVRWVESYPSAERFLRLGLAKKGEAKRDGSLSIEY